MKLKNKNVVCFKKCVKRSCLNCKHLSVEDLYHEWICYLDKKYISDDDVDRMRCDFYEQESD